jgi:predicted site-specific integrase-resolvase
MELTTSQAMQAYKVFPNVLHRMILMGRLKARKNSDGRWLISKESLERWDSQRVRKATKKV